MADDVRKILSKFKEPRGVLKRDEDGSELLMERPNQAPLKLSGDKPEAAELLYKDMAGGPSYSPTPDKAALKERLKIAREDGEATEPGLAARAANMLQKPQQKLLDFAARKLGEAGGGANSETSSQQIVENIAKRLGVPEDSVAGNVAKAAGVAGLEVFADPLSVAGPVAKGGMLASALGTVKRSAALESALQKIIKGRQLNASLNKLASKGGLEALRAAQAGAQIDLMGTKGLSAAEKLKRAGAKVLDVPANKMIKSRP